MADVRMTHPDLPDREVVVSEVAFAVYQRSGWQRVEEPKPKAAKTSKSQSGQSDQEA